MPEVTYTLEADTGTAFMAIDTEGPVNSVGRRFMMDFERAMDEAVRDEPRGLILVSGKKRSFLDGINLKELLSCETPQVVRLFTARRHGVSASPAKARFPVVALLDGQTALGGGFELLLWACDHVFTTPTSRMGFPETSLGLFPCGGGTQTLPRVVGLESALDMILNARVGAPKRLDNPDVFTICPSEDLRPRALKWIEDHQGTVNRNYDPEYRGPHPLSDEEKRRVLDEARSRFTVSPYRPYHKAAIDAVEAGLTLPFDEATANETDLFVPLVFNDHTRNKIDLFYLTTGIGPKLVKLDAENTMEVKRIAVIGAGLMGQGIAQIAVDRGIETTVLDINEETARASVKTIERTLDALVSRGKWPEHRKAQAMSRIHTATTYSDLEGIPLVIECVFEELDLKQQVLAGIQQVNPDAVFASNTSTIPMAKISQGASRPENVVGMHFFSPVPLMPLLEVVRGGATSADAVSVAVSAGRALGKTVIIVGDGPGFYTSRTFGSYVLNGIRLVELGMSPWDVDMTALRAGFAQGPLHIYGTTGGNVIYHAAGLLAEAFPDRIGLPESLIRLHEAGYVGAGHPCFYLDNIMMTRDESVLRHLSTVEGLPSPTPAEAEDILLLGMVNEAFWCLSDGILHDYYGMELGAVLGIGFPDCLHGPARYASRRGIGAIKARLEELGEKFAMPALTPAPEFEFLAACGLDSSLI
ncbi:MAG: 3-hydroxyacyl-CoA dehydrogenase NAD-binding domain-containing protein [Pseudomonadota bacterium]